MDISALKYFIVVAQTEHMNRAAAQLHITQPSLSTCIRRLEADIGFRLFDRNGRNIQLNEYGKADVDKYIERCDHWRKTYYRVYTGHEMGNYHDYDIIIDVGRIGVEKTLDLLVNLIGDVNAT